MSAAKCPQCGKPMVPDYRPFCSKRCADVDLARWLRGDYVIPGPDGEIDDQAPPNPDDGLNGH
ncbi:DNA gyrase inhibitor YacG [Pararhodobacter sp.]|uniref:DNA gyrase inhibitor YacG n=1 Tax=Pararhodobacter sp. TaxID=2127056 RepID=UPI002AFF2B61|nr:DNA gyrase inhibitor YacG [Pararhodobacter sp.]